MRIDIAVGSLDGRPAGKTSASRHAARTNCRALYAYCAMRDGRAVGTLINAPCGPAAEGLSAFRPRGNTTGAVGPVGCMKAAVGGQIKEVIELAAIHRGVVIASVESTRAIAACGESGAR